MKSIIVIGAGGHAKVVIEAIRAVGAFAVSGVVDPNPQNLDQVLGAPWLGGDDILPALLAQGYRQAVVGLGENGLRQRLGLRLIELGFDLPVIIHPSAQISPSASIGRGSIAMARSCIGPMAVVGELAIINTGAIVEHDNRIDDAAHIAPGAALGGNVRIGARSTIGIGSSVRPGIALGRDVMVGVGSAVISDFPDGVTIGGIPARVLRP